MLGGLPDLLLERRMRIEQVVDAILQPLNENRRFSMIRLGDGEGAMMRMPHAGEIELAGCQQTWWGDQILAQRDLDEIAAQLRAACADADILGLPNAFQLGLTERYRRVFEALTDWGLPHPRQRLADANLHWYLQLSGAMEPILRGRRFVGVIGCRDLGDLIVRTFDVGTVRTWQVRGESRHPGDVSEPHWPDGFARTMDTIAVDHPGQLFLVGAGVLGKIYCHHIQTLGGVAIDIGSVLDGWAGVHSRVRFGRYAPLFAIDRAAETKTLGLRPALEDACRETGIVGVF